MREWRARRSSRLFCSRIRSLLLRLLRRVLRLLRRVLGLLRRVLGLLRRVLRWRGWLLRRGRSLRAGLPRGDRARGTGGNANTHVAARGPDLVGPTAVARGVFGRQLPRRARRDASLTLGLLACGARRNPHAPVLQLRPHLRRPAAVACSVGGDGLARGTGRGEEQRDEGGHHRRTSSPAWRPNSNCDFDFEQRTQPPWVNRARSLYRAASDRLGDFSSVLSVHGSPLAFVSHATTRGAGGFPPAPRVSKCSAEISASR
jgi:hypothetical protein